MLVNIQLETPHQYITQTLTTVRTKSLLLEAKVVLTVDQYLPFLNTEKEEEKRGWSSLFICSKGWVFKFEKFFLQKYIQKINTVQAYNGLTPTSLVYIQFVCTIVKLKTFVFTKYEQHFEVGIAIFIHKGISRLQVAHISNATFPKTLSHT